MKSGTNSRVVLNDMRLVNSLARESNVTVAQADDSMR
jgi:hypothetical protein